MTTSRDHYGTLIDRVREIAVLGSTAELLSWDQETMMPAAAVEYRGRQLGVLSRLTHESFTSPEIGELISSCEDDPDLVADPASDSGANLRELRHRYDRATKLPPELVEEATRTASLAHQEWIEARKASDYERFRPWLEKNLALARQEADHYGWPDDGEPWDALADGYEQGMTAASVTALFGPLRERLVGLVDEILGTSHRPSTSFAEVELPVDRQEAFVRKVAERIGFDFSRGRLDVAVHPFCGGTHYADVRLTTRYKSHDVGDALMSTMHEAGHGIYEQGLPPDHLDTPLGRAASLGVHESQSRMWENQVGRSEAFWRWCLPVLQDFFGEAVAHLTFEDVHGGLNRVEPSLIRVEADEATYNLHIMVRFEIERLLLNGDLDPADLPDAWNERYRDYLGVDVPDDAHGCLQDTHWSGGAFGYFPTYTLGNVYCAQLFEKILEDIPDLYGSFEQGDFSPLKSWLNENLHRHGSRYCPEEMIERATGRPVTSEPLLRHLEGKLRPLYGL